MNAPTDQIGGPRRRIRAGLAACSLVALLAVRDVRYKLIGLSYAPQELYDLLTDPFESTDLAEVAVPGELQSVVRDLEDYRTQLLDSPG